MKKILSFILVAVLCLGVLTGCDLINKIPGFGDNGGEEEPVVTYDLAAAAEFLTTKTNLTLGSTKNEEGVVITQSDYVVIGQIKIRNADYTVSWSTDSELVKTTKNEDGSWTIDVTSDADEAYNYKLTATIVAGDNTSTTVEFNLHVKAYNLSSFEEYMAAGQDDIVTIEGVVVAMNAKSLGNSRNHLFLADKNVVGGYYVYQMDADPIESGIKIGMTVSVTGPVSPYSGMQEIKGGVATIIDETIADAYAPVDITEAFSKGESLKNYVGLPVTVKGVTIGGQDLETTNSQYLYFELNGVKSYIRTYITDFPTTLSIVVNDDSTTSSADKTAIDEAHAAKFGWTANVTGILVLYNSNPYLIPMTTDCFEYLELVEKSDADKVASEKDGLSIDKSFSSDKVIDLLAVGKNYPEVSITWTSDNENFVIADGKATITVPDAEVTVKVTATLVCGDVTDTKEFSVKLSKTITSIVDAIEIGNGFEKDTYSEEKYMIAGIVKEVYNTTYGNMYLVDEYGNEITVYGSYSADGSIRYDKMENAPKAGDYVVVLGILGKYNSAQMKNGWILSVSNSTLTVPEASAMGAAKEHNTYTEEKYLVTGEITEIKSDKYGNMYLQDAEGNSIYVYGLYSSNGVNRYDAMTTKPAVGDTITVLSIVGQYNGTAQLKNAWLVAHTAKAADVTCEHEWADATCTAPKTCSKCGETEGEATGHNIADGVCSGCGAKVVTVTEAATLEDGTLVFIEATVSQITYNWSDTNGNMSVDITDGTTTLNAYKLATKVAVGDVIVIYGKIGSYNGTKQIAAGATAEIKTSAEPEVPVVTDGKYVFGNYTAGEQYATETHTLSESVSLAISDCHLTSQLRLYYSEVNEYNPNGRKGVAVFTLSSAAEQFVVSAGGKTGKIAVYGSTDGENWTLLTTLEPTSTYTEYEIALGDGAYTSLKLEAVDAQARVDYVIIK